MTHGLNLCDMHHMGFSHNDCGDKSDCWRKPQRERERESESERAAEDRSVEPSGSGRTGLCSKHQTHWTRRRRVSGASGWGQPSVEPLDRWTAGSDGV